MTRGMVSDPAPLGGCPGAPPLPFPSGLAGSRTHVDIQRKVEGDRKHRFGVDANSCVWQTCSASTRVYHGTPRSGGAGHARVRAHPSVTPQEPPSAHSPGTALAETLRAGRSAPACGGRGRRSAQGRRRLSKWTDCPRGQCREASRSREETRPVGPGGALLGVLGQDGRRAADGDGLGLRHGPSACRDLRSSCRRAGSAGVFRLPGQGRQHVWGAPLQ